MACTDSFKNAVVRVASVKTIKIDSLDPMTIARPSVQIKVRRGAGTRPQVKMIYLQIYRRIYMQHDSLLSSAYCYSVSAT